MSEEENKPELWEGESLDFQLDGVELSFSSIRESSASKGKLFITSRRLLWLSSTSDEAFDFDIAFITLHAISRDPSSYPLPCIYCQLDVDEFGDEGDDETEFFLISENESDLKLIFDALSRAAMLNPDPPVDGEFDGDDEFIYDLEEVQLGAEQARMLNHLESVFNFPNEEQSSENNINSSDQFEDEEDEDTL